MFIQIHTRKHHFQHTLKTYSHTSQAYTKQMSVMLHKIKTIVSNYEMIIVFNTRRLIKYKATKLPDLSCISLHNISSAVSCKMRDQYNFNLNQLHS